MNQDERMAQLMMWFGVSREVANSRIRRTYLQERNSNEARNEKANSFSLMGDRHFHDDNNLSAFPSSHLVCYATRRSAPICMIRFTASCSCEPHAISHWSRYSHPKN